MVRSGVTNAKEMITVIAFPYHSSSINNVCREIDFSESNNLVMGILYGWIISVFYYGKEDIWVSFASIVTNIR